MNFIVSEWLAQQAKLRHKQITVSDAVFDLITLTDDQIKFCDGFDELDDLIKYAAETGLAIGQERAIDVPGMTVEKMASLWTREEFKDCDPEIITQIGMEVCEMSDLLELVEALTPEEDDIIDGDDLDESLSVEDLQAKANNYANGVNV